MNFEDFPAEVLSNIKDVAEKFFKTNLFWNFSETHKEWYGDVPNCLSLNKENQSYNTLFGLGDTTHDVIIDLKKCLNGYILRRQISSAKFLVSAEKDFNDAMSFEEIL